MEEEVPGSEIMQCLLDEDVQMLPGTIDAYMREGRALAWFRKGAHNSPFDLDDYASFGKQDGHTQGRQMCHTTMTDSRFCGFYRQASREWVRRHGAQRFGPTYRDSTPLSWSDTFLSCSYQAAFSQHILNCVRQSSRSKSTKKVPSHLLNDPRFTCRTPTTIYSGTPQTISNHQ